MILRFVVCARACMCVAISHGVPLLLCCLLHSTGTPTLSLYIVDIRPLTSLIPSFTTSLARRGFALEPAGSACVVLRTCAAALRESHYAGFVAQSLPYHSLLRWTPFLPPTPARHAFSCSPPPGAHSGKITINDDTRHFFACESNLIGCLAGLFLITLEA